MASMSDVAKIIIEEIAFPASAFDILLRLGARKESFLLESAQSGGQLGRWSLVGAQPFLIFSAHRHQLHLQRDDEVIHIEGSPFSYLAKLLQQYPVVRPAGAPPLLGGAVGYFGYDLCQLLERLPTLAEDDLGMPDCWLGFYDVTVAIDHQEERAFICSTGWPEIDADKRATRAQARLEEVRAKLTMPFSAPPATPITIPPVFTSNFAKVDYLRTIARAKDYIAAGDIYQVNLSQRFTCPLVESPVDFYARLRAHNPAPFAGLLQADDWALVGASPERFLQIRGDWVETRPIKGTRPRGRTAEEDQRLAQELLHSEKDRAENIMIVDLERNDLGKVCEYGTVKTTEMWALEAYPTVFHLVSTVEGRLRQGHDSLACLRHCFPGGSITGAPKVRAMEIIEELEPTKRGPYTGAMGYLSFCGDMDMNIIIRTISVKDGQAHYQVGGGIVADSDPEAEYQETLDKGRALQKALGTGGE
jgi:para-aminobenzoate synthetase component I